MNREQFSTDATDFCQSLAKNLHAGMLQAYDDLTEAERISCSTEHQYHLLRSIGAVIGPQIVEKQFNVAAITKLIGRVRRILKARGWRF